MSFKSNKRLRLFVYFLSGRAKDLRDTLPRGTITTGYDMKKALLCRFFRKEKYLGKWKEIVGGRNFKKWKLH